MSTTQQFKAIFSVVFVLLLTACGDDSGSKQPSDADSSGAATQPIVFTGILVNSVVENIKYTTASQTGFTNSKGEFMYQSNEMVRFSIGDIQFPETAANVFITPLNIFTTQDINNTAVVNTLRLLQSLDSDGDASNGIQIPVAAHTIAKSINVDFSSDDFDSQVSNLVAISGSINTQLIEPAAAVDHFQQSLNALNKLEGQCEKTHAKVGYSGTFKTFAHGVSGKVTVIDDCTLKVSQFSYDGGGPDVYFYGAINHEYKSDTAFTISQQINGILMLNFFYVYPIVKL